MPFQITAILGYPVLEALDRVAVGTNQLHVTPDPQGVPSDSSNLFLDDLQPLIAVTVDDSSALYHFDSGADVSILGVHFCRAYAQRLAALASHQIQFGGAGGSHEYGAYTIARLPVSVHGTTATLDSVSVLRDSTAAAFEPYYGNLGQDLVTAFGGFTIDFRAMTFRLGTSVP